MVDHTPLPWVSQDKCVKGGGALIAETVWNPKAASGPRTYAEAAANAALIDRACNALGPLVAVLTELRDCSNYWSEYDVPLGITDRIDAALKLAEAANG